MAKICFSILSLAGSGWPACLLRLGHLPPGRCISRLSQAPLGGLAKNTHNLLSQNRYSPSRRWVLAGWQQRSSYPYPPPPSPPRLIPAGVRGLSVLHTYIHTPVVLFCFGDVGMVCHCCAGFKPNAQGGATGRGGSLEGECGDAPQELPHPAAPGKSCPHSGGSSCSNSNSSSFFGA